MENTRITTLNFLFFVHPISPKLLHQEEEATVDPVSSIMRPAAVHPQGRVSGRLRSTKAPPPRGP